jgi:hypothetical protein
MRSSKLLFRKNFSITAIVLLLIVVAFAFSLVLLKNKGGPYSPRIDSPEERALEDVAEDAGDVIEVNIGEEISDYPDGLVALGLVNNGPEEETFLEGLIEGNKEEFFGGFG